MASVKLAGATTNVGVMVEDLCVLGCLLEYGPGLEVHQECEFSLAWQGREFQTPAVVAWKGEQGQVGLEFRDIDPAHHRVLRELCNEFLNKPLVRLPEQAA